MSNRLSALVSTEQVNPRTQEIDLLSTEAMLARINAEDLLVPAAITPIIPQIAVVVDKIAEAFRQGRHLFYFGAGTSGRLGVLDASECPPTFGANPEMVQAFIAGGETALRHAVEGAEDSAELGLKDFQASKAQAGDVVIGISASGGAPYVLAVVQAARQAGCYTAAITSYADSALAQAVDQALVAEVGPEVIAGSTRLKAGTAQKLILNMLTTGAMIQIGKTYENLMVDVQPTNQKLKARASRMVAALADTSVEAAAETLEQAHYQVKPAVLMLRLGLSYPEALQRLDAVSGKLRAVLQQH